MTELTTKALDAATWPDFAQLVEANNGVWGGCWCMWYHDKAARKADPTDRRAAKQCRVEEGRAHAALVFDGAACVGWCQFGSPQELPHLHNERAYVAGATTLPDWRITCFFSGKGYRRKGVATTALGGALAQIAARGGGTVEGYPEDIEGRKASAAFLFNGALSTFERHGFERQRLIGKHKWVVVKQVENAATA
ncbi:MAG: GNAT family N-acetyltransferase [Pseudomonadota bacterium]